MRTHQFFRKMWRFNALMILFAGILAIGVLAFIAYYGLRAMFREREVVAVDEAFEGPALQPTNPVARARVAQIMSILDFYVYRPAVWGIFVERVSRPLQGKLPDEQMISAAVPQVRTALTRSENCSRARLT